MPDSRATPNIKGKGKWFIGETLEYTMENLPYSLVATNELCFSAIIIVCAVDFSSVFMINFATVFYVILAVVFAVIFAFVFDIVLAYFLVLV